MQKTKKLLAIGLSCLTLISCTYFVGCKENTPAPTYECSTCLDEGIIDCPNCHVKKCDYKSGSKWCKGGSLFTDCDNCNTKGYIGHTRCSNCGGDGYDSQGYKCRKCSSGYLEVTCPSCRGMGGKILKDCPQCDVYKVKDDYMSLYGGEPCQQCKIPYSTTINYGYSYIDCPDCEQD